MSEQLQHKLAQAQDLNLRLNGQINQLEQQNEMLTSFLRDLDQLVRPEVEDRSSLNLQDIITAVGQAKAAQKKLTEQEAAKEEPQPAPAAPN